MPSIFELLSEHGNLYICLSVQNDAFVVTVAVICKFRFVPGYCRAADCGLICIGYERLLRWRCRSNELQLVQLVKVASFVQDLRDGVESVAVT
jgi:hypothetical protein